MIKNFKHKGLADFFYDGTKRGILPEHARKLADILDMLDNARTVDDMNFAGSNLHRLKGELQGFWAVKVSGNWRVIFRFQDRDVVQVDYLDYH